MPEYDEFTSRVERRKMQAGRRAAHRRNVAIALSLGVIVLVVLVVAGWLIYRKVNAVHKPVARNYTVVLPEGLNNKEVAARFDEETNGSVKAAQFTAATRTYSYKYPFLKGGNGNLEGFLFPNTYDVTSMTSAHTAVQMMLKDFGKETDSLEWSRAAQLGVTPYQIVTIASIIEKEVKIPEERPLVASVIYNRLKKNMKLGMCSTVLYALGEWKPKLTDKDLQVDSPYNTYKIDGLPPGPINSPGKSAIEAALSPADGTWIYWVVVNPVTGETKFASTLAEHQTNVAQFQAWCQANKGKC